MNTRQQATLLAEAKGYSEQVLYWLAVAEQVTLTSDGDIEMTFPNEMGTIQVYSDGTFRCY